MAEIEVNGEIKVNGEAPKIEIITAALKEIEITDYIRNCLDKVAYEEGFRNFELIFDHGSNVGDGFVGLMLKVIIKEHKSDKSLQVLAKIPPQNKVTRDTMKLMPLFEREVFAYNVLLPELMKLQEERKVKDSEKFCNFPKVYFAEFDEEKDVSIIIMEDLREKEYKMWDKAKPVNIEHAKLLMTSLGRYHGLSFALKALKPELFEKFKSLSDLVTENFTDDLFDAFFTQSMSKALEFLPEEDVQSRAKFQRFMDIAKDFIADTSNPSLIDPHGVIVHGDNWVNNYLFHYEKGNLPDKIIMIDWQIARYCTPVVDLVYFIFACTNKQLRDKHYDELINIYHRSLKEILDHCGGDTATQFPFTALLRHLKRFGKYGVIMSAFIVPMMNTKKEDLVDMDFMANHVNSKDPEHTRAIVEQFNKQSDVVSERMRDVIYDAIKYGYL